MTIKQLKKIIKNEITISLPELALTFSFNMPAPAFKIYEAYQQFKMETLLKYVNANDLQKGQIDMSAIPSEVLMDQMNPDSITVNALLDEIPAIDMTVVENAIKIQDLGEYYDLALNTVKQEMFQSIMNQMDEITTEMNKIPSN